MENNAWDQHLRDKLGDFHPDGDTPHWAEFAARLDSHEAGEPGQSLSADEQEIKSQLSEFEADQPIQGWDRIEASLNAQEKSFDHTIRNRIREYETPYDPHSWAAFMQYWSSTRFVRTKIILLKSIEAAAVLLLVLAFFNVDRYGLGPGVPDWLEKSTRDGEPSSPQDFRATLEMAALDQSVSPDQKSGIQNRTAANPDPVIEQLRTASSATSASSFAQREKDPVISRVSTPVHSIRSLDFTSPAWASAAEEAAIDEIPNPERSQYDALAYLNTSPTEIAFSKRTGKPDVAYTKSPLRTYAEFGIVSAVDYNGLRMPEDRFYSYGQQIVFPSKGIFSPGYGGGFTIALAHPKWALETGVMYSAKNFKPGRQLVVGGAFDNGRVDFQAMRLQLVSLPVQFRYRVEDKGRMKAYALAGLGWHVIAQSDIDVTVRYQFPSLSFGENPNSDPDLAETIRETKRISEHIRDGAPFSGKTFVTMNAGLGLEYNLVEQRTLFLQSTLQYQIPDLKFSNNNGKHLRSLSIQAGIRTPIGN